MPELKEIVDYCDSRVRKSEIADFPGAFNGLQFGDSGQIKKIGAAVDAGIVPFRKAIERGVDFLIVHHGLYWNTPLPMTGLHHEKFKLLFENNLAVYGSHLPLDAHQEIGNNAIIAQKLGLKGSEWFLEHEGTPIGLIVENNSSREELASTLKALFPKTFQSIEFGSEDPRRIAICSGSGGGAIEELAKHNVDTLITGELRQHHFNMAQEMRLNLYPCGHYATEVFGVQQLAKEVAGEFNLPWEFIEMECPL